MPGQDCVGYRGKSVAETEWMRGGLERCSSRRGDGWPGGWCDPVVSPLGELEAAMGSLVFPDAAAGDGCGSVLAGLRMPVLYPQTIKSLILRIRYL